MLARSRIQPTQNAHLPRVWLALGILVVVIGSWMPNAAVASTSASAALTGPQMAAAKQCAWAACPPVLSAVAAGTKLHTLPANLSPSLQAAAADVKPPPGMAQCVVTQSVLETPFPCVYNSAASTKRMVLIGDSHAEMWSTALAAIAKTDGYSLLFLAKIPCPLPLVGFFNVINETPNSQCTTWKKWAFTRIQQFDPSIVIATTEDYQVFQSNAAPMSQSEFSKGLVTTLKDLSAPGRRVILLGDIPYLKLTAPLCLSAHEGSIQSCSTPTGQAINAQNQAAQRTAATKSGAQFVNVIPWFCTQRSCPAVVDNIDVYADCCHITTSYSMDLEAVLEQALNLGAA